MQDGEGWGKWIDLSHRQLNANSMNTWSWRKSCLKVVKILRSSMTQRSTSTDSIKPSEFIELHSIRIFHQLATNLTYFRFQFRSIFFIWFGFLRCRAKEKTREITKRREKAFEEKEENLIENYSNSTLLVRRYHQVVNCCRFSIWFFNLNKWFVDNSPTWYMPLMSFGNSDSHPFPSISTEPTNELCEHFDAVPGTAIF